MFVPYLAIQNAFNPRSYKRSDFVNYVNNRITLMLSIHAPTRGATISHSFPILKSASFNPRSYKRSDCEILKLTPDYYAFNPRSYKRSDFALYSFVKLTLLSIHAPTRGATGSDKVNLLTQIFQSTLLQEERHPRNRYCFCL